MASRVHPPANLCIALQAGRRYSWLGILPSPPHTQLAEFLHSFKLIVKASNVPEPAQYVSKRQKDTASKRIHCRLVSTTSRPKLNHALNNTVVIAIVPLPWRP